MGIDSNNTISSNLKEFTEHLSSYMNEYDNVTVKISTKLPDIERQIDENIQSADELRTLVQCEKGNHKCIQEEFQQFNTQLNSVVSSLNESKNIDKEIFKDLKNTIEIANNSVAKIDDIDNISENLKVFAINSIVYAEQAGPKGRGYQFISGQFIKLSEDLVKSTQNIKGLGGGLNEEISLFLKKIINLEKFNHEHLELITKDSEKLIVNSNNAIKELSTLLTNLVDHIKEVKEPTFKIMVLLQKQDIIHQQMVHMHDILNEMLVVIDDNLDIFKIDSTNNITVELKDKILDIFTILNFLLVTTEQQMIRINKDLLSMVNELEIPLQEIMDAIEVVKKDEKSLESNNKNSQIDSIIHAIFRSPLVLIDNITKKIDTSQKQKRDLISIFKRINDKMISEKELSKNLIPHMDMIKNLLFLAQVEQARNQLNILIDMNDKGSIFSNAVFKEMDGIISGIENAQEMIELNLHNFEKSFNEQRKKYKDIDLNLAESRDFLSRTENLFISNYDNDIEITDILLQEVNEYQVLFTKLKLLHHDMNDKISICTDLKVEVKSRLDILGGAKNLNECSFRNTLIKKIINNLTVDEERVTILNQFQELKIEKTVGDSITLF